MLAHSREEEPVHKEQYCVRGTREHDREGNTKYPPKPWFGYAMCLSQARPFCDVAMMNGASAPRTSVLQHILKWGGDAVALGWRRYQMPGTSLNRTRCAYSR